MSPIIGNFVHDLVEMAKATEALPVLQDQVEQLTTQAKADGERIARLEAKLIDAANRETELLAKVRSAEAERDDAGFRILEAEDKHVHMLNTLQDLRKTANEVIVAVTGSAKTDMVFMAPTERSEYENYKAEKIAEAERLKREAEAAELRKQEEIARIQREADEAKRRAEEAAPLPIPIPVDLTTTGSEHVGFVSSPIVGTGPVSEPVPVSTGDAVSQVSVSTTDGQASEGKRDVDPTGESCGDGSINEGGVVPLSSASSSSISPEPSSSSGEVVSQVYAGKRYHDWPAYVSLSSWLAGGGTEEDYHWRPVDAWRRA